MTLRITGQSHLADTCFREDAIAQDRGGVDVRTSGLRLITTDQEHAVRAALLYCSVEELSQRLSGSDASRRKVRYGIVPRGVKGVHPLQLGHQRPTGQPGNVNAHARGQQRFRLVDLGLISSGNQLDGTVGYKLGDHALDLPAIDRRAMFFNSCAGAWKLRSGHDSQSAGIRLVS
jgi:hypothetical protein